MRKSHGIMYAPDSDGSGDGDGTGAGGDGKDPPAKDPPVDEDEPMTPEQVAEIVEENAKLRTADAKRRTEAARATKAAKDAARKAAQESGDAEALQKQLDDANAERVALEEKLQRQGATAIAESVGVIDPPAAIRLLDWDSLADPGNPTEVEAAIRQLVKEKPYLKKPAAKTDAGASGGGNDTLGINDAIRRAAGRG
jgi:hypothetical protein